MLETGWWMLAVFNMFENDIHTSTQTHTHTHTKLCVYICMYSYFCLPEIVGSPLIRILYFRAVASSYIICQLDGFNGTSAPEPFLQFSRKKTVFDFSFPTFLPKTKTKASFLV